MIKKNFWGIGFLRIVYKTRKKQEKNKKKNKKQEKSKQKNKKIKK